MIKVGLYFHGNDHTIEKYSQILLLFNRMKNDNRFETYYVIDKDPSSKVLDILSELNIDKNEDDVIELSESVVIGVNKLDIMLVITPYPPHPVPHYKKWDTKIIYKEYGTTGIDKGYENIWKHDAVYKYSDSIITDSKHTKEELLEILGKDKGIVGSPAYDYRFFYNRKEYNDGLLHVLWTPHHSIYSNKLYDGILGGRYSTWLTYKYIIPNLVNKYPIKLYIKFHPNLERRYKQYCRENHSNNDYNEYINEIYNYKNVEIVGNEDYYQLFMNSDAMINDSISFLQEYLPTEKPMLVLYDEGKSSYNKYGESLIDECYYRAYNEFEIDRFIEDLINKRDCKYNSRVEFLSNYYIDSSKPNVDSLVDIIYNKYSGK